MRQLKSLIGLLLWWSESNTPINLRSHFTLEAYPQRHQETKHKYLLISFVHFLQGLKSEAKVKVFKSIFFTTCGGRLLSVPLVWSSIDLGKQFVKDLMGSVTVFISYCIKDDIYFMHYDSYQS